MHSEFWYENPVTRDVENLGVSWGDIYKMDLEDIGKESME
jgi:hypothetical protein